MTCLHERNVRKKLVPQILCALQEEGEDWSATRPSGWHHCALLEYGKYESAVEAYEGEMKRLRESRERKEQAEPDPEPEPEPEPEPDSAGKKAEPEPEPEPESEPEPKPSKQDNAREPGELEPGEILQDDGQSSDASKEQRSKEGQDKGKAERKEEGKDEGLYLLEWSRLGPLRLPPMPRSAALTRQFRAMPGDFHFTSLGL